MALTKRSQSIVDLKTKLANQGKKYTAEALAYRDKIAELTLGFIKDDSVASFHSTRFSRDTNLMFQCRY